MLSQETLYRVVKETLLTNINDQY